MPVKRTTSAATRARGAAAVALLVVLGAATGTRAQDTVATVTGARRAQNEFGLWGGGSVGSSTMIGRWTNFDFGMLALRYARNLWSNDAFALDWTIDGVPLALISLDRGGQPKQSNGPKDVVYGAGIAPIGLRLDYDGFGCWRPYFATNVGFLMFEQRIPATGTKFNYTWDFGLGTQLFLTDDQAISLGYDFKHISNAYSGETNPGFDSNIFYLGYSFFR
jgi:lipid A 3-O-deacylase PagL